jgi:hypothetical protein
MEIMDFGSGGGLGGLRIRTKQKFTHINGHLQGKRVVYSKAPDQADDRFNRSNYPVNSFLEASFQSQSSTKTSPPP